MEEQLVLPFDPPLGVVERLADKVQVVLGHGTVLWGCDSCGSLQLLRIKGCYRCERCGYKSDCNGF